MTSVNAELFHRDHDPSVHYGPVWGKPRGQQTFAACGNESDGRSSTLTTHMPWVTCSACKEWLSSRSEE